MKSMKYIIEKKFWLILILTVLISYGQILWMQPWQDDNALFFKLAHIQDRAGYLGYGPFGEGAYKYTATPYIPIYFLFGFWAPAYFTLSLFFYLSATLVVYFVFKNVLGEKAGRIVGFLYAAGYIASDGIIRLFNSILTSFSAIFLSFLLLFYWKYYKENKLRYYFSSLAFFFVACEFIRARTHYFLGVVLAFEIIFLAFRNFPKSTLKSIARLIPFTFIFYEYFILNADSRSGSINGFITSLLHGQWYQLYGFLSTLNNLVIPNWITGGVLTVLPRQVVWSLPVLLGLVIVWLSLKTYKTRIIYSSLFLALSLTWFIFVRNAFSTPVLSLTFPQYFSVFMGGLIFFFLCFAIMRIRGDNQKLCIFFSIWIILNIVVYSAYNPTVTYETINRYLAHSFLAFVGLAGLSLSNTKRINKVLFVIIMVWGIGNLVASINYQHKVLVSRTAPVVKFYSEFTANVKQIDKGDVFYFDVDSDMRGKFADAFSVAQMPETTAIAWRYGVDRYDFEMYTDFPHFAQALAASSTNLNKVHTFWYTSIGLVDTSEKVREALGGRVEEKVLVSDPTQTTFTLESDEKNYLAKFTPVILNLSDKPSSVSPLEIKITLRARLGSEQLQFPYLNSKNATRGLTAEEKQQAVLYLEYKDKILKKGKYFASSEWQDRKLPNLHDNDSDTVWQADRVLWQKADESYGIDLGKEESMSKFVWVNGFANNTPTKYSIEVSRDGINWQVIKTIEKTQRIEPQNLQAIELPELSARFIRMHIFSTLNGDSPAIAEAWIIPNIFKNLNLSNTQKFLDSPFSYLSNLDDYQATLQAVGKRGKVTVFWSDDNIGLVSDKNGKIDVLYDGLPHSYTVYIPPHAEYLQKLEIEANRVPGTITVEKIEARNLSLPAYLNLSRPN